jgi:uncharacterized membrane protein YczE
MSLLVLLIVVCLCVGIGIGSDAGVSAWRLLAFVIAAAVAIQIGYVGGTLIEHVKHEHHQPPS